MKVMRLVVLGAFVYVSSYADFAQNLHRFFGPILSSIMVIMMLLMFGFNQL